MLYLTVTAVRAVIGYCFGTLGLTRVQAVHAPDNPAPGRVMEKAGMKYEGTLRSYHFSSDRKMYSAIPADYE